MRGALRPSEVTRDAALFGEFCALPPAKCDEAVEAFLGMLDREQGSRSEMLRRAVRGDQRSRSRSRDDAPAVVVLRRRSVVCTASIVVL